MSIPAFYSGTGRRKTAIARVRLPADLIDRSSVSGTVAA